MLDSGLINKMQKAKNYADEPERIRITDLRVEFSGNHSRHDVEFRDGSWRCDCEYFRRHQRCSHVMALDRVLGVVTPAPA